MLDTQQEIVSLTCDKGFERGGTAWVTGVHSKSPSSDPARGGKAGRREASGGTQVIVQVWASAADLTEVMQG